MNQRVSLHYLTFAAPSEADYSDDLFTLEDGV